MTMRKRALMRPTAAPARTALAALSLALVASGCSLVGGSDEKADSDKEVVVISHESFQIDEELVAAFEKESGYTVKVRQIGDAGALSAELALNADNPRGDVAFGVDNTFASRVLDAGVFDTHEAELPLGADAYDLLEGADRLAPIDYANVCMNVDKEWFAQKKLDAPKTLDDLLEPAYRDLLVVPGASTSSPGMAFLLTTVAAKGDAWPAYWTKLLANGAKVVDGWSDAYYTDFTAGSEKGKRPIVLSYDSSPAFLLDDQGNARTDALEDTCFTQVEYAGVLEGADNVEGAREFVQFLLSDDVQNSLPTDMYVFGVSENVELPDDWAAHTETVEKPWVVSPADIAANRETWLREWTDVVQR